MVSHKLYLLLICISLFLTGNSQTGPGGIGSNDGTSNLIIWYRSDNGITASGTDISSWSNSAGYSTFNLNQHGESNPKLISNSANGYNEIQFDAKGTLRTGTGLTTSNFITNQASSYIHLKANSITKSFPYQATGAGTRFLCHIPWSNSKVYFDIGICCNSNARVQVGGLTGLTDYSLWSYDALASTGKQLYRNGTSLANVAGSSTFIPQTTSRFTIGRKFDGNMTEVIVFKSKVNTAQRLIIQNYISAKYNQPLTSDDLFTQDEAANGNFDHNVAGIGQANDGTNHTDSQGTGIVRINTPSSLSNGDYLFWGEETKDPSYNFTTNTSNYLEQLNSKWRISKINNLGTVNVTFNISSINLSGKQSCENLQLVVDNDSDFTSPTKVYNLTISGTTATVNGVAFNDGDYFTLQYLDQIVWDGSTFFNGSGVGNIPVNIDSCLKMTIKSGSTATLNNDVHVREIEVEAGAKLNVSSGYLLEVDDQVVINGIIDLLGESQLIQNHTNSTSNSGSGFIKIRQQGVSNFYNYNYWSAPVNTGGVWQIGALEDNSGVITFNESINANPATSPVTLSNRWLYKFYGPANTYSSWSSLTPSSNLSPGDGYTMKGSGSGDYEQEYIFKGTPNDGNYSFTVTAGNDFLTGNPYPSTLDADEFIKNNLAVIDGTLSFWEQFSTNGSHYLKDYEGGYSTYTLAMSLPAVADASGLTSGNGSASKAAPTQNINVGQGFFVSIENSGNLVFNNSQRVFALESLGETIFYKNNVKKKNETNKDNRPKIRFSFTKTNSYTKYIGLAYDKNASTKYDKGYDAKAKAVLSDDIFWDLDNEKLIIQALNHIDTEEELALIINITDSGRYEFYIDDIQNFPNDANLYLKDNKNNIYYDLKNEKAVLNLTTEDNKNRFSITFKKDATLSLEKETFVNTFLAFYNWDDAQLILDGIDNLNDIKTLTITNTLGQEILNLTSVKSKIIDMSNYSDGLYILKAGFNNGKISKPIKFIKH